MVEPITLITTWGLSTGAKFVYGKIIDELKKDTTKEWAKDVLQDWLKDVFKEQASEKTGFIWNRAVKFLTAEPLDKAAETAITAFLALIDFHLAKDLELSEEQRERFQKPLNSFFKESEVRQVLGIPFKENSDYLDIKILKETWDDLGLRDLPDKFNWDKLGQDYLVLVRKAFYESAELKPLLDFQRQEKDSKNLQAIAGIETDFNLIKYQETILEKYCNLKIESLDVSAAEIEDKELKIYDVFIPQKAKECQEYLPQVYELPKDIQLRLKESGELERKITLEELERYKRAYTNQEIESIVEIIRDDRYKYIVILGDPGSGKSILLQYLAVNWARLLPREIPSHPLTLLIELREYIQDFNRKNNPCNNFLEFIHQGSNWICHLNQHELDKRLEQGEVRILFDGLDEVFDPQLRETIINQIHSFTQTYDKVKVIVTSRIIGYKPRKLKDAEFHHFMLQDLDSEQIDDFLKQWHELTYNEASESQKKQDRQERITKAIKESSAIQQLAGNPLLLTMMAILNRNQDLPRDRGELYNQSSRLLLHQWDVERALINDYRLDPKIIDYRDKQEILRRVAYQLQQKETGLSGNLISARDLEQILIKYLQEERAIEQSGVIARLMIQQLRSRNFILCDAGSDYYAFVHRTFLEYFCAWSYIWQFKETQTLSIEQIKTEVYGKHWQDETWHEVLRLIAGMLDPKFTGEIIEYLMAQEGETANFANLFLAANCLNEVRNRKSIKNISNSLTVQLQQLICTTKHKLDNFQHTEDMNSFKTYSWMRTLIIRSVNQIAVVWHDEPDTLLLIQQYAQSDDDSDVRSTAIRELAKGWHDELSTLSIVKKCAQSDNIFVRMTAISELTKGWHDEPDTLSIIQKHALYDDDELVKIVAMKELAKGWHDHSDTLLWLKERAQSDDNWKLRRTAVQELAKGWHDHPNTLLWLKECAQSNNHSDARSAAAQELAEGWHDHPDTFLIIKDLAQFDNCADVRTNAIVELAKGWHDYPKVFDLLINLAVNDPFVHNEGYEYHPRQVTIDKIVKFYPDRPETKELLIDRANRDRDEQVRDFAQQQLNNLSE